MEIEKHRARGGEREVARGSGGQDRARALSALPSALLLALFSPLADPVPSRRNREGQLDVVAHPV